MTRVTVLPGATKLQQQQAPVKAQPTSKSATPSQKAAPVTGLNPTNIQFKGKENPSSAGRTPPASHSAKFGNAAGKVNIQNTFGPVVAKSSASSAHTSRSNSAIPQRIVNHKKPDWCDDDVSMHELNHEEDDLWYMAYLFGAPPSPQAKSAPSKPRNASNPPLPVKAKPTQQKAATPARVPVRRQRNKKPLSAQERAEINYFVAHLFDGPASRVKPQQQQASRGPVRRQRVKKLLSAQEKAEINYFVSHLFDGPSSSIKSKIQQKQQQPIKGRGNKKPLTHQEKFEISNFVTHLFDGTRQLKIKRKQEKLTTAERNEICYFVNHLFDYGKTKKPIVIKKKALQKKKPVFLHNAEKENARKAVFEIWAAANPGWGTSRHQNGPYPKSERSQRARKNRQAKKAARARKALRRHRNL
ncbi:UNVERIFIED_CONTAM: hypothetical protein HDU68_007444 [Siphonaria sp. JEL0065]|nr:hypothetical protein HDU68_007444 [Siphonaria sp. JEL0065]